MNSAKLRTSATQPESERYRVWVVKDTASLFTDNMEQLGH